MKLLLVPLMLALAGCASAPTSINISEVVPSHELMLDGDYDVLEEYEKIGVPTFKVAFAVQADVYAYSGGGRMLGGGEVSSASAAMTTHLTGVDIAKMQAITDAAYARFMEQLKSTGREVVPFETLKAHASFKEFEIAKTEPGKPYKTESMGRTYLVFVPTGMPLFFYGADPLSDQFIGMGNTMALGSMSYDLKLVTAVPTIVIDFALTTATESGGALAGGTLAEVSTTPELAVVGGVHTNLAVMARNTFIASATLPGVAPLKAEKFIISTDYGQVTEVSSTDNEEWASAVQSLLGAAAATNSAKSVRQIDVSGDKYQSLVSPAIDKVTAVFANAIDVTR